MANGNLEMLEAQAEEDALGGQSGERLAILVGKCVEPSPRRNAAAEEGDRGRCADEPVFPTLLDRIQVDILKPSGVVSSKIPQLGSDEIAKPSGVVWQEFWAAEPNDVPDLPARTLDFDGRWAFAPKFLPLPPKIRTAMPNRAQSTDNTAPCAPRKDHYELTSMRPKTPVTAVKGAPVSSKQQSTQRKTKTITESLANMEGEVTIMVRNVAANLKQEQLLAELQRLSLASFCNFAYIPCHDSTLNSNSYMFLNFKTAQAGAWLVRQWDGYHQAGLSSEGGPALNLSLAQVQGLEANLANLRRRRGNASGRVLRTHQQ
jgi:hypothetical protein